MKKLFLFLIILFALFSCWKKKEIKVTIYNPTTKKTISGIPYVLGKYKTEYPLSAWSLSDFKVSESGTSDENGSFMISKWGVKKTKYSLRVEFPDKYFTGQTGWDLSKLEKKTNIILLASERGEINLKVVNSNCFNEQDELTITHHHDFFYLDLGDYKSVRKFNGCFSWDNKNSQPEGYHYFKSELIRNGTLYTSYDTIYLYADSTKNVELNF